MWGERYVARAAMTLMAGLPDLSQCCEFISFPECFPICFIDAINLPHSWFHHYAWRCFQHPSPPLHGFPHVRDCSLYSAISDRKSIHSMLSSREHFPFNHQAQRCQNLSIRFHSLCHAIPFLTSTNLADWSPHLWFVSNLCPLHSLLYASIPF